MPTPVRRAWSNRNWEGYQDLARKQTELGVEALDLNIDGTQTLPVKRAEMLELLPEIVPAIQEVTSSPICFDNPFVEFHKVSLKHYDREKGGPPIMNSVAASRDGLDEFVELVAEYDMRVIVMASERFAQYGSAQCLSDRSDPPPA